MLVWLNNFNNASFETFQTAKIINLGKSDNNGNVKGFLKTINQTFKKSCEMSD